MELFSKIFKVPKKIFQMPECGVNEIAPIFSHINASQRFFYALRKFSKKVPCLEIKTKN